MDLNYKAHLIAKGHQTANLERITSVRIALTYAALLGINVLAADILNE